MTDELIRKDDAPLYPDEIIESITENGYTRAKIEWSAPGYARQSVHWSNSQADSQQIYDFVSRALVDPSWTETNAVAERLRIMGLEIPE